MTPPPKTPDMPSSEEEEASRPSRAELQLEREKVEIERERLTLERERLAAEREKWRDELRWKHRERGVMPMPVWGLALLIVLSLLVGALSGIRFGERKSLRRDEMVRRLAQAIEGSTNVQEKAQGTFLLKALSAPERREEGPYFVIID